MCITSSNFTTCVRVQPVQLQTSVGVGGAGSQTSNHLSHLRALPDQLIWKIDNDMETTKKAEDATGMTMSNIKQSSR